MPTSPGSLATLRRKLIHRWFVRYNPLYFFSTLCILLGVFLMTSGFADVGWQSSRWLVTLVVQAYELLIICGAAMLARRAGQTRPAVILAILELCFLLDPTFQTEALATFGQLGRLGSVVWLALAMAKLGALAWIFRLRPSLSQVMAPALATTGLALAPHLMRLPGVGADGVHLAATWLGALLAMVAFSQVGSTRCGLELDEWGQTVRRRVRLAVGPLSLGFYLMHLGAWAVQFHVTPGWAHAAPLVLVVPLLVRAESWLWLGAAAALGIGFLEPPLAAPTACAVAVAFGLQAWRSRSHQLLVGCVLSLYVAGWTLGWQGGSLGEPSLALTLPAAALLAVMAVVLRLPLAAAAALLVMLPSAWVLVPRSKLEWGVASVALGFTTLVLGLAVSWSDREACPDAPS